MTRYRCSADSSIAPTTCISPGEPMKAPSTVSGPPRFRRSGSTGDPGTIETSGASTATSATSITSVSAWGSVPSRRSSSPKPTAATPPRTPARVTSAPASFVSTSTNSVAPPTSAPWRYRSRNARYHERNTGPGANPSAQRSTRVTWTIRRPVSSATASETIFAVRSTSSVTPPGTDSR